MRSVDLPAIARAQRVLLSPLSHPSAKEWAREALRVLQEVFRSERAVLTLGGPDGTFTVTAGVRDQALAEYEADHVESDGAGDLVLSLDSPYYVEADLTAHDGYRAHTSGAVYNDWYRPHGLTEALGLFVVGRRQHSPDLYAPLNVPIVANVLLASSPLSVSDMADHARDVLAVLHPAFSAGVETLVRAGGMSAKAAAVVDGTDAAAWLFDADATLLHESTEAVRRSSDRGRKALRGAAMRLARDLVRAQKSGLPNPQTTLKIGGQPITLVGTYLRPWGRRDPAVLVSVSAPPTMAEDIRERFELTRRQADVACLLADRLSNKEVAEALYISPHTARHHTQAVLEALGLTDRRDVAAALRMSS